MKKTEKLTLIEGHFSAEEAQEILMSVFFAKINFHEMKNFSSQERFGKKDEAAQKKIPILKASIDNIKEIVAEAKLNQKKLVITSEINISFSD